MDLGIIIERLPTGQPRVRSNIAAPSRSVVAQAEKLDRALHEEVARLESALVHASLLREGTSNDEGQPRGKLELWHALGVGLGQIAERHGFTGARERRWLWEAIYNLHASPRIKRVERGKHRNHFEYCYRLGRFPLPLSRRLKWSEWVYFFDSPTVREERRADEWLRGMLERQEPVTRAFFRNFSEALNRRIRKLDTSVLSKQELFAIYDAAWAEVETAESHPRRNTTVSRT